MRRAATTLSGLAAALLMSTALPAEARPRAKCESCGVIETIRRLDAVGDSPAGYEFIVRLRDGSARVSRVATSSRWQAGDRIMLIGGTAP
jgi:hypothetical protein